MKSLQPVNLSGHRFGMKYWRLGLRIDYDSFLHRCQHDDGYIDNRSQIKVHIDERTQIHKAWSSLMVTHPSTNRGRRCLTSVNVPLALVATISQKVNWI